MVIEGSVMFTIGDERRELGPGGTWRIPSNVPHQVTTGPAGATVIDVFNPTRADWDALPVAPAQPPRRLATAALKDGSEHLFVGSQDGQGEPDLGAAAFSWARPRSGRRGRS